MNFVVVSTMMMCVVTRRANDETNDLQSEVDGSSSTPHPPIDCCGESLGLLPGDDIE